MFSEKRLSKEIKKRNPKALEHIIDLYGNQIYALVRRVMVGLGSPEDIEECVSDVFTAVWEGITDYDSKKGSFKTWIFILAKYKALDYRRKKKRDPELQIVENYDLKSINDTEVSLLSKENMKEIIEIIEGLGDMDKRIFYKRYFLYEDIEAISKDFDLTREAVYKRLYRSRKILKKSLGL